MAITYFGVCNSDGTPLIANPNQDFDGSPFLYYNGDAYVCPGSGNQVVQDLTVYCYGNLDVRLGIYSSDGTTLIAEGTSAVTIIGSDDSVWRWQGHIGQANIKAAGTSNPAILVGGTSYKLAVADNAGDPSPWIRIGMLGSGTPHYEISHNYISGMPSSITTYDYEYGNGEFMRVGVSPAATTRVSRHRVIFTG